MSPKPIVLLRCCHGGPPRKPAGLAKASKSGTHGWYTTVFPGRQKSLIYWVSCIRRVCGRESHSLRHYTVLLCIRLFDSAGKTTSSATKDVAASSAMLPLVTAQTVAFDRGFGGRIWRGRTHARKAQTARRRTRNPAWKIP